MNLPRVEIGDPLKIGRYTRVQSAAGLRAHYSAITMRLMGRGNTVLALPAPEPKIIQAPPVRPTYELPPGASVEARIKATVIRFRQLRQTSPGVNVAYQAATAAAQVFGEWRSEVVGPRRTADLILVRQLGMTVARIDGLSSLPQIARQFGGRNHTTVLHAANKWRAMVEAAIAEIDGVAPGVRTNPA